MLEKDSAIRCSNGYGHFVSPLLGYAIFKDNLPIAEALIRAGVVIDVGGDSFRPGHGSCKVSQERVHETADQ